MQHQVVFLLLVVVVVVVACFRVVAVEDVVKHISSE